MTRHSPDAVRARARAGAPKGSSAPARSDRVAVIVTTYNDSRFLPDALRSVFEQVRPPDEVIVVDDGSAEDPRDIVSRFPGARLIRQENQGLSGARNTGLLATSADLVLFLDADDILLPSALSAGLACLAENPDAAFVYGAYMMVNENLRAFGNVYYRPAGADAVATILLGNAIGMHATVLYRREVLAAVGGFDRTLRKVEDYEIYLRIASEHPVASHPEVVTLCRRHGRNMSLAAEDMLRVSIAVHDAYRPEPGETSRRRAWSEGRELFRAYWIQVGLGALATAALARRKPRETLQGMVRLYSLWNETRPCGRAAARDRLMFGGHVMRRFMRGLASQVLPVSAKQWMRRRLTSHHPGAMLASEAGGGAAPRPVSIDFGYDRGDPIDRYYIEGFLERHRADVRGRVLEVGEATYSRRYGGDRVERQDVLHVHPGKAQATIVGDISQRGVLPASAFDCIILTQTLHLIFDMQAALEELHAALKPGGVLLLTVPGITPVDRGEWRDSWYWSLTAASVRRLCERACGEAETSIETHGNVLAATAFLQGLAQQDLDRAQLDPTDGAFPVIITLRLRRPG